MARKQLETIKIVESEKLRERAIKCHRLAVGAGDPQFTLKLNALADEYEAKAVQADARATMSHSGSVYETNRNISGRPSTITEGMRIELALIGYQKPGE